MYEINLCKHCEVCQTFIYDRQTRKKHYKFLYCKGNKELVESYDWYIEVPKKGKSLYVMCSQPKKFGYLRLHTYYARDGFVIDHKDQNGLNNTLKNLRLIPKRKNSHNRPDNAPEPCIYKKGNRWYVRLTIKGKQKVIKTCKTKEEAIITKKWVLNKLYRMI